MQSCSISKSVACKKLNEEIDKLTLITCNNNIKLINNNLIRNRLPRNSTSEIFL